PSFAKGILVSEVAVVVQALLSRPEGVFHLMRDHRGAAFSYPDVGAGGQITLSGVLNQTSIRNRIGTEQLHDFHRRAEIVGWRRSPIGQLSKEVVGAADVVGPKFLDVKPKAQVGPKLTLSVALDGLD